jgi:hypothetical protein
MRTPTALPQICTPDVAALIDAAPVGWRQREIFFLCGLITLCIAFVAPSLAAERSPA